MNGHFASLVDIPRPSADGLPIPDPFLFAPPDVPQQDDALLDDWLASLTPARFGQILDSLTRLLATSVAAAG